MHTQPSELDALIQALDKSIPDRAWLKFLELTSRTGVADTRQLQLHLGWTRGIFSRRAEKILISTLNGEPLVSQIDRAIKRPTEANRPPAIIRLEKGGAQLLRSMGVEKARASELKEDIPILHGRLDGEKVLMATAANGARIELYWLAVGAERQWTLAGSARAVAAPPAKNKPAEPK
jgi:hypothetical protein